MEGMTPKEIVVIQQHHDTMVGLKLRIKAWSQGLITKLLKTMHGQWLYCKVVVYDSKSDAAATKRKDEIQM